MKKAQKGQTTIYKKKSTQKPRKVRRGTDNTKEKG
jgi:hypothetical protein